MERVPIFERLMSFEDGQLDNKELIDLFQELVNNGMAWQLQGFYGRTAIALINEGLVTRPKEGKE